MKTSRIFLFIVLLAIAFSLLSARELKAGNNGRGKREIKTSLIPSVKKFNINNISTYLYNDGISDQDNLGNSGFSFPKESLRRAFFESGFLWGGKVDGNIRVGGSTYQSGLMPGKIVSPGVVEDPTGSGVRIYRVRPDYQTASLSEETNDYEGSEAQIRESYRLDWMEWPADKGAPFNDIDKNGKYDPGVDIPGVTGAAQTLWFVANDLDQSQCRSLYGSDPIGLEMQVTIWGYNAESFHKNMLLKKYKLINKSGNPVSEMYLSLWSDPDVGEANDDLAGCDTTLNLIYGYNGGSHDNSYNYNPPAVGFQLLQGPVVNGTSTDMAYFDGRWIKGKKNLPMTSFYYFINAVAEMGDPALGNDYNNGTLKFWNLLQGKMGQTGEYFPVPASLGGGLTKFPLSGNPESFQGYLDGILYPSGDRRMGASMGPFNFAAGDTQEVVFAQMGAIEAGNNLANVSLLKNYAADLLNLYKDGISAGLSNPGLISLGSQAELNAFSICLDPLTSISSYSWELISAPVGSRAVLNSQGNKASIMPDKEGKYTVSVTITDSRGHILGATRTFEATNVQKPHADFNFSNSEVIWGDSVLCDASISSDPLNLQLNYKWSSGSILSSGTEKKTYCTPLYAGLGSVSLTVDNNSFSSSMEKTFKVKPWTQNLSANYYFSDPSALGGAYLKGDSLYTTELFSPNKINIYAITEKGFEFKRQVNVPDPIQKIMYVEGNRLYCLVDGASGYFGVGLLNIYSIGSDWSLTPILKKYKPGLNDISPIILEGNTAYIRDLETKYYKVDFSDAYAPAVINSYPGPDFIGLKVRGKYISQFRSGSISDIFLYNKETFRHAVDWSLPNPVDGIDIKDSLLFVTYHDTLDIYRITPDLRLTKLSSTIDYCPVKSPWPYYSLSSSTVSYINNDLLCLGTDMGFRIYNVSNPASPALISSFYGAWMRAYYNNGKYFIIPDDLRLMRQTPETNISCISFDNTNSVENMSDHRPSGYSLLQNYPNPFNPSTTIKYSLPVRSNVRISIFNAVGQKINEFIHNSQESGNYEIKWDADGLSSGIYFYSIHAVSQNGNESFSASRKMVLIK